MIKSCYISNLSALLGCWLSICSYQFTSSINNGRVVHYWRFPMPIQSNMPTCVRTDTVRGQQLCHSNCSTCESFCRQIVGFCQDPSLADHAQRCKMLDSRFLDSHVGKSNKNPTCNNIQAIFTHSSLIRIQKKLLSRQTFLVT
jgi:hypothetical protein